MRCSWLAIPALAAWLASSLTRAEALLLCQGLGLTARKAEAGLPDLLVGDLPLTLHAADGVLVGEGGSVYGDCLPID